MLPDMSRWLRIAVTAGLTCSSIAALAADPVKLGLLEDASGNFALATIPKIHATQLAVDEINAKGGILGRPMTLFAYETQSDNTKFQGLARLVDQTVKPDERVLAISTTAHAALPRVIVRTLP